MIKAFIDKYFNYIIVGEYYDSDGNGHYRKRYTRKYYPKRFKKQYFAYLNRKYHNRKRGK